MKKTGLSLILIANAFAHTAWSKNKNLDPCRTKARDAVALEAGNSTIESVVRTLSLRRRYKVTVDSPGPQGGVREYSVVFPKGCDFEGEVVSLSAPIAHPQRDATQSAYGQLLAKNDNALPEKYRVTKAQLPARVLKQYANLKKNCGNVGSYSVTINKNKTFALTSCAKTGTQILVFDARGKKIDVAEAYSKSAPGADSSSTVITWENTTE